MLADPRDMLVGFPGGHGCCSPEWGKSLVETCGLVACWVGWVLTGDLSGTKTAAVGLTGHSEKKRHKVKTPLPITEKIIIKSCFSVCESNLLKPTKTVFPCLSSGPRPTGLPLTCPGLGAACWGGGWFPVGVLEGWGWWTAPEWWEKDCGATGDLKKN